MPPVSTTRVRPAAIRNCSDACRMHVDEVAQVRKYGLRTASTDDEHYQRDQPRGDHEQPVSRQAADPAGDTAGLGAHAFSPRHESMPTAEMMTMPTTATCHSVPTPSRLSPLRRMPTASAPMTVPAIRRGPSRMTSRRG